MLDKKKLDEELIGYTPEELQYIHDTQQDLYSEEELAYLLEVAEQRRSELKSEAAQYLPREIECEKCGAPNPIENEVCQYCENKLDKKRYYDRAYKMAEGLDVEEEEEEVEAQESFLFQKVISFLIPLVGFILGAVMLANDNEEKRSVGKSCILLALAGVAVAFVLVVIFWNTL